MSHHEGPLGWVPPKDRDHEKRFALTSLTIPRIPTAVVIGVPWHTNFDNPVRDAINPTIWWIGRSTNLGPIRGGHCVCLRPPTLTDLDAAWPWYDQGQEGACVGFGTSRAASLFNKRLYDAYPLYKAAQKIDPWPGENYSGTSVNAGLSILRKNGPYRTKNNQTLPYAQDGITSYAWASNVTDVLRSMHSSEPFVRILNSWGRRYPREVRMPADTLNLLLSMDGEAGVPIDRTGMSTVERKADGQ